MSGSLVCLSYKSRVADSEIDERALADILTVAQAHNIENGITGAVAFGDGHFVQVLEGRSDVVLATMARIMSDDRHHSIEMIGPRPIARRAFPDWCMARLTHEPSLRPLFSLLIKEWATRGGEASDWLARGLDDQLPSHQHGPLSAPPRQRQTE